MSLILYEKCFMVCLFTALIYLSTRQTIRIRKKKRGTQEKRKRIRERCEGEENPFNCALDGHGEGKKGEKL